MWGDGRREWHGYQQTECFSSSGWWAGNGEGPHGTAQKIPEWLTKMTFLVKSCIKPWFGVMGFSANDTILDLRFSLNKYSILTKKSSHSVSRYFDELYLDPGIEPGSPAL